MFSWSIMSVSKVCSVDVGSDTDAEASTNANSNESTLNGSEEDENTDQLYDVNSTSCCASPGWICGDCSSTYGCIREDVPQKMAADGPA